MSTKVRTKQLNDKRETTVADTYILAKSVVSLRHLYFVLFDELTFSGLTKKNPGYPQFWL